MLSFAPIISQVVEDPRNPWVLPGAVIFVWVIARWFFARKNPSPLDSKSPEEATASAPFSPEPPTSEPETEPLATAQPIPDTDLVYLVFSQPPMAQYAMATSCYTPKLNPTLAKVLSGYGSQVFMILAADETTVFIQNRQYSGQMDRRSIREISLHPILPAKGSGMVSLNFVCEEEGQLIAREFMACPVYSPELQQWCLRRAKEVGAMLDLLVKVGPSSHDC